MSSRLSTCCTACPTRSSRPPWRRCSGPPGPAGYIIVNVAALDCLKGDHSVLGREVRRYSRESLARLLTDAGFVVERITYTNASLFLPMLAVRTYQRWRGLPQEADAESDISVPAAPINRRADRSSLAGGLVGAPFQQPVRELAALSG